MPFSKLDIYNQALNHVGKNSRIQAVDEQTDERETCDLHYTTVLEDALSRWDWSFAHTELALVDVGTPPTNWAYRYTYPSNCHVPRYIVGESRAGVDAPIPFEVMRFGGAPGPDKVIVTDTADAVLAYTIRIADDEASYSTKFVDALAHGLASAIAGPLTKSMKIMAVNQAEFERKLVEAAQFDARFKDAVRNRANTSDRTALDERYE